MRVARFWTGFTRVNALCDHPPVIPHYEHVTTPALS
nr:MAG TPA: hypothetical protein [Bacteriophage sp.]